MPEIGETLREARMRQRIDMTEVETATKIRGKYLRALENEEWDLLPGPTFVKTFLRTYAEYLDLDPRLLVEEYRQRYERPSTQDLTPFSASRARGRVGRRRRRLAALAPLLTFGGLVVLLLAFLYLLGSLPWADEEETPPTQVRGEEPTPSSGGGGGGSDGSSERPRERERKRERARRPQRVRLQLVATAPVYVCVVDARGRQVIDEETLAPDTTTRTLTSRRFLTNFGNNNIRMRVNGRTYSVAPSADPVGYELLPGRRPRRLSDDRRPDCSS
jgi:cytoskeleton protein RodZ